MIGDTQVDRLKAEGHQGKIMFNRLKHREFELADAAAVSVYPVTSGFPRAERILPPAASGLMQCFRDKGRQSVIAGGAK